MAFVNVVYYRGALITKTSEPYLDLHRYMAKLFSPVGLTFEFADNPEKYLRTRPISDTLKFENRRLPFEGFIKKVSSIRMGYL